jgi:hypothetical protein
MSESIPTGDTAVFALVEMFALAFAFEGTAQILNGGSAMKIAFAYTVAVGLFVAGLRWPWLKSKISPKFADSLIGLANDARVWFVALLIVFGFIGTPSLIRQRSEPEAGPVDALQLKPDLRLAPFAKKSTFFDNLPTDPNQSFVMACFPYDPMSCNIAAQYRDRLADHWTPDNTIYVLENPASITGIAILTVGEHRPSGALELRSKFRDIGIDAGFPVVPSVQLKPDQFAVIIGAKP